MNRSEKLRNGHKHTLELHQSRNTPAKDVRISTMSGMSEAEGVSTKQLSDEIKRWRKEFEANHPRNEGKSGLVGTSHTWGKMKSKLEMELDEELEEVFYGQSIQMGPLDWLAEKSGLDHRVIQRILRCETKFTTLTIADNLLNAIGSYHKLAYEIHVIPNPQWTNEKYLAFMEARGCV